MIHFVHLTVTFDTVVNERSKMSWRGVGRNVCELSESTSAGSFMLTFNPTLLMLPQSVVVLFFLFNIRISTNLAEVVKI